MRIPIFVKLISIIFIFLIGTIFFFSQQTVREFSDYLKMSGESTNNSEALNKLKEVDFTMNNIVQKAHSLGNSIQALIIAQQDPLSNLEIQNQLSNFDEILSLEILKLGAKNQMIQSFFYKSSGNLIKNNFPPNLIEDVRKQLSFPFMEVFRNQIEIQNSSFQNKYPLLTLGLPLVKNQETSEISHILLVTFEMGLLQKIFSTKNFRTNFLVDKRGGVLSHPDEASTLARNSFVQSPIISMAIQKDSLPNKQISFIDPLDQKQYLGAYARNQMGLISVSQIEMEKIIEPALKVKNDAVRIAGQVLALAFFISFLFSLSLTQPLETLSEVIQKVAKGNFNIKAQTFVNSSDEVGDLAKNFDHMTEGLKERDKMKNLFNKFHGSSITEDLLKSELGVGGVNQEVTIFFSDIRGFTSFSEKRSPEEVVEMLNQYFSVMVSIINKNNGVVDKFIGDAIMAVWGVPKKSEQDSNHAVMACLEMRKALASLNEKRALKNHPPILIGMGLHSGKAISGTIGSEERMEYTVIGDTVNLASRIEASTKAFGTDLLVSEEVMRKGEGQFKFELAGEVEAKGKEKPLKLYNVLAYKKKDGNWENVITEFSTYDPEKSEKIKTAS